LPVRGIIPIFQSGLFQVGPAIATGPQRKLLGGDLDGAQSLFGPLPGGDAWRSPVDPPIGGQETDSPPNMEVFHGFP
jgi:hypothetical protein